MNPLTPNFLKFILILSFRLCLHFLTGITLKFSELISVLLKVATANIALQFVTSLHNATCYELAILLRNHKV